MTWLWFIWNVFCCCANSHTGEEVYLSNVLPASYFHTLKIHNRDFGDSKQTYNAPRISSKMHLASFIKQFQLSAIMPPLCGAQCIVYWRWVVWNVWCVMELHWISLCVQSVQSYKLVALHTFWNKNQSIKKKIDHRLLRLSFLISLMKMAERNFEQAYTAL